jgi:hypothetical protein
MYVCVLMESLIDVYYIDTEREGVVEYLSERFDVFHPVFSVCRRAYFQKADFCVCIENTKNKKYEQIYGVTVCTFCAVCVCVFVCILSPFFSLPLSPSVSELLGLLTRSERHSLPTKVHKTLTLAMILLTLSPLPNLTIFQTQKLTLCMLPHLFLPLHKLLSLLSPYLTLSLSLSLS